MVNQQSPYAGMRELALFAGAGGGLLASKILGWRTVCAVEWDNYARNVLVARQNDGSLETFPIWSDVQNFDGRPWRGIVDIISGGFPCQDISAAGKGAGIDGERSGMWKHFARIIGEVRPRYCFIENSPMLVTRGLDRVLSDLASLGYDAKWLCLSAGEIGAWHERNRIWILATNTCDNWIGWGEQSEKGNQKKDASDSDQARYAPCSIAALGSKIDRLGNKTWGGFSGNHGIKEVVSRFCRMDDGLANRAYRIAAIGNGQVPQVASRAFRMLSENW
jgi:DNA (cytosine-5)-methyltransferase 1